MRLIVIVVLVAVLVNATVDVLEVVQAVLGAWSVIIIVTIVQLVICAFIIIHVVTVVLNIGAAVVMVVAVVMEAVGQCAIQHVKVVMVIVILITQDSTYSSIFRAGNGVQCTNYA